MLHQRILASFDFRERHFEFEGIILDRINVKAVNKIFEYKYRVRWEEVNPKELDALISLVYVHQREMLLKNNVKN